jgi:hypothetical protein
MDLDVDFKHSKVNHKYNFNDPATSVYTKNVEEMWRLGKWQEKKHQGTVHHHLEPYQAKFVWQSQFSENPFNAILEMITQ